MLTIIICFVFPPRHNPASIIEVKQALGSGVPEGTVPPSPGTSGGEVCWAWEYVVAHLWGRTAVLAQMIGFI